MRIDVAFGSSSTETQFERRMESAGRTRTLHCAARNAILFGDLCSFFSCMIFLFWFHGFWDFVELDFSWNMNVRRPGAKGASEAGWALGSCCSPRKRASTFLWGSSTLEVKDAFLGIKEDAGLWKQVSPSKEGRPPVISGGHVWIFYVSLISSTILPLSPPEP